MKTWIGWLLKTRPRPICVGMSMPEAAEALGLPLRSAERLWTFAKTWLRHSKDP